MLPVAYGAYAFPLIGVARKRALRTAMSLHCSPSRRPCYLYPHPAVPAGQFFAGVSLGATFSVFVAWVTTLKYAPARFPLGFWSCRYCVKWSRYGEANSVGLLVTPTRGV